MGNRYNTTWHKTLMRYKPISVSPYTFAKIGTNNVSKYTFVQTIIHLWNINYVKLFIGEMAIYNIPVPFITNVINFAWNRGLLFYNQAAAKVESREAAKKSNSYCSAQPKGERWTLKLVYTTYPPNHLPTFQMGRGDC